MLKFEVRGSRVWTSAWGENASFGGARAVGRMSSEMGRIVALVRSGTFLPDSCSI